MRQVIQWNDEIDLSGFFSQLFSFPVVYYIKYDKLGHETREGKNVSYDQYVYPPSNQPPGYPPAGGGPPPPPPGYGAPPPPPPPGYGEPPTPGIVKVGGVFAEAGLVGNHNTHVRDLFPCLGKMFIE